ncbi:MAG: efflux RND transporter permease subunit [Verrucomicrobiales bacterium]|nr:efflux RND transporter permease subunit [Verrucomicrobiales bacterium]
MTGKPRNSESGAIAWFVRNPVAANLSMLVLLLGGIISMLTIEKNIFPTMRMNHIFIEVAVPGAAPAEIEQGVVIKIEEAVREVEGIGRVFSRSAEDLGVVQVDIMHGFDSAEVMDEVSSAVNAISGFPDRARKPIIRKAAVDGDEVISVQLYGELDEKSMTMLMKSVRREILHLPGVSQAEIEDSRDFEISVEVSPEKLRRHNITIPEVVAAIQSNSTDLSGGSLRSDGSSIRLRGRGPAVHGDDFRAIPLREGVNSRGITIGDVAEVNDGFVETDSYVHFDGEPSLSLMVRSVPGENILRTAREVKKYVSAKNENLPESVKLSCWTDASGYLKGRINLMVHNLGIGALLVFLVLLVFLQLRLAFWVIVGIPVAFCGAIFLMPFFDVSINMISIFGFILVLGIVVDDAIVIAENIHTTVEKYGAGAKSVIAGANEVALPATFGVITTIVAFLPMTRVSGSLGPIWMSIGAVVMLSLAFSLIESKWILPAHLLHLKPENSKNTNRWYDLPRLAVDRLLNRFIDKVYRPLLKLALRLRYLTIGVFVCILALCVFALYSGVVRFVFFPELPSDYMIAKLEMASGTSAEATGRELRKIESALRKVDQESGSKESNLLHIRTRLLEAGSGEFFVELSPSETRTVSVHELAAGWSREIGEIPGAVSFTVETSLLADDGAAVNIELTGSDLEQLKAAGDRLKETLEGYVGILNAKNSVTENSRELTLTLTPQGRAAGLNTASVIEQVRAGFHGVEAQRIQRGGDEVKVMVRYPGSGRDSEYHLKEMWLRTPDGNQIPFKNAVNVEYTSSISVVERVNGVRLARVTAAADKSIAEPGKIASRLVKNFPGDVLEKEFPGVSMELAGQNKEELKSIKELLQGFIIAVFCIYACMAVPLRSYVQPLIIMAVIPFGFTGAIVGHMMLGLPFSVLSLCGIIALAGVVVNDSLVFVDFVNRGRARGLKASEAAREAGAARFRAIFLTSLTTFIGLIPIILEKSVQAVMVIPMAVTLAFGILFATVITLFLLPALYLVIEDLSRKPKSQT